MRGRVTPRKSPMQWTTVATVFGVIFIAELPDKSLFASLVLATRHRPLLVWIGASAAFVLHSVLAVLAGGLLTLLPHTWVSVIVALLFALGAVLLLRHAGDPAPTAVVPRRPLSVVSAVFGVVFLAEFGDVTQLAIANLSARYADPLSVGLGAALGLCSVAGLAVLGGARLLGRVPLPIVRQAAGVVLGVFAVLTVVELVVA